MSNRNFEFRLYVFSRFTPESCMLHPKDSCKFLRHPRSRLTLEEVIDAFLRAGRTKLLAATAVLICLIAVADWSIGARASLGILYILPMMLGAIVLLPAQTAALAVLCSLLRSAFDLPSPLLEALLRFVFAVVAYTGAGMFVTALIRNRQLALNHLGRIRKEQELRHEVEEHLKVLVESSPAAILTTDSAGAVLASNHAASALFLIPSDKTLVGRPIGNYIPVLSDALKLNSTPEGFRTAAQCQGRRENGEIFLAHTWFSCYETPKGTRLAAIVVDSSEEMREREEEVLEQLIKGNRIAAAAVSHEVRNLCSAILLLCSNLREKYRISEDADFQGLTTLAGGLEKIASYELYGRVSDDLQEVILREVLDDLRIVIEPAWREIDGTVLWDLPKACPTVLAEREGLLQAFLNLAKNSHRAVQHCPTRELRVVVSVEERIAHVRFRDSGTGISDPEHLFQPFQAGADGAGLGLYVSRAVVRGYGGDLSFEPQASGSSFRLDIPLA